jgi:hypothetical protein
MCVCVDIHRWASPFSPFINGYVHLFLCQLTYKRKTSVCRMSKTVNGEQKIACASVFHFLFDVCMAPYPCLHVYVSMSISSCTCIHVMSCLHVSMSLCLCLNDPCLHVSMSMLPHFRNSVNGKCN